MRLGVGVRVLAGAVVGVIAGAAATLAVQPERARTGPQPLFRPRAAGRSDPVRSPARPATFLAWTHGGLPEGFEPSLERLEDVKRIVVVANDNTWLTGSLSAQGQVVDDPPKPYAIPMDVSAARPKDLAPFLPPVERGVVVDLESGQGVLGASSAKLRGLGPGALLFFGRRAIEIAAVLPDELVGAAELLVSKETGARIGVTRERYALIETRRPTTSRRLKDTVSKVLPAGVSTQVRAPGETPYLRQGDAVLPPVLIKILFGEFAARPMPGRPGFLEIDPAWVRTHIATERLPLLGAVTCNRALIPQIRAAMLQLRELGLASTVRSYSGCYSARFVNRVPTATISHHSWGIAFDINVPQNPFGATPHQDPGLVEVLQDWGFIWGGTFLVPDGMHFEYHRPPPG
jgi:hypothetical protein